MTIGATPLDLMVALTAFDSYRYFNAVSLFVNICYLNPYQPLAIELIFFGNSEEITRQQIKLKGSSDQWQEYKLEVVENVTSVKMELHELTNDTARYITFNEVRFYGY